MTTTGGAPDAERRRPADAGTGTAPWRRRGGSSSASWRTTTNHGPPPPCPVPGAARPPSPSRPCPARPSGARVGSKAAGYGTVTFPPTDIAALARGYGFDAVTVRTPADLKPVEDWVAGPRTAPLLIDAKVTRDHGSWWLEEAFRGPEHGW